MRRHPSARPGLSGAIQQSGLDAFDLFARHLRPRAALLFDRVSDLLQSSVHDVGGDRFDHGGHAVGKDHRGRDVKDQWTSNTIGDSSPHIAQLSAAYLFFISRTPGGSARVNTTTSSPV